MFHIPLFNTRKYKFFLTNSYNSLNDSISTGSISSEFINIIRSKIKHFINTIEVETPDKQILMLKEFVQYIRYNLANDVVEIKVAIISPENSSEIIFQEFLYSSS